MSLNRVTLIGNLGRDPEIRSTQDGREIATLSVATSERWKKDGEWQERTEWHRVSVFNEALVKIVKENLEKGSHVFLEGKLQTRKWTDKEGIERYSTEIIPNWIAKGASERRPQEAEASEHDEGMQF